MPRAHRYVLPDQLWHITHRCHQRAFLLKFAQDRRRWIHWLYQAKRRHGLCVLDYIVTANHIHLLVRDQGHGEIAQSLQLIAGRTAQEYNRRTARRGAFWEDRYHATAVDSDAHLARCLVYIDLNMVRAGVVNHPSEWPHAGYREIHAPPQRYAIIDLAALTRLLGFTTLEELQSAHTQWVTAAVHNRVGAREPIWTESLAVGSRTFVDSVQARLGIKTRYRTIQEHAGVCARREPASAYAVKLAR
jgi:putative transposase